MSKIIFSIALAVVIFTVYLGTSSKTISTKQYAQNALIYDTVPKKDTVKKASMQFAFVRFNINDTVPKKDSGSKKESLALLAKN